MQTQQPRLDSEQYQATVDRTVFSVVSSFRDADQDDTQYWWAQPADVRLRYLEQLRQLNYGHHATARLQRILDVAQRP